MDKSVNHKRIEWIDIMKGIAIIAIVITHSSYAVNLKEPIAVIIYSYFYKSLYLFHVPFFFFISGYLYKQTDIKSFTKKSVNQLLIPYITMLLLFFPIAAFIFPNETNLFNSGSVSVDILRYILGRNLMNGVTGTLWFLTCLFFTQVVYNIIINKFKFKTVHIIVFILLIISYLSSYYNNFYNPFKFWLPFNFHLIFATIPLYHIGYIFNKYSLRISYPILSICMVITIAGIIYFEDNLYNIYGCFYGIPFFTLFCSIILISFMRYIAIFLSKNKNISAVFIYLGKASLTIMAFHLMFIIIVGKFTNNALIIIILSILLSLIVHEIFTKFSITRALFLGNRQDIQRLKEHFINKKTN